MSEVLLPHRFFRDRERSKSPSFSLQVLGKKVAFSHRGADGEMESSSMRRMMEVPMGVPAERAGH